MIVDPDFMDHWRTGMVADAIQDPMAPVYILRLWAHCQERRSDTFVMPTRGLKAQCKAPGDAETFERALIDAGFIERNGDTITVTGWAEKNAALFAAWENGNKGGRPKKRTQTEPTENPRVTHGEPTANPNGTHAEPIREEKSREEKKNTEDTARKRAPPAVAVVVLVEAGFSSDLAAEFIAHKHRLKAPLTERAWADHQREAHKAGWSAAQAAEKVLAMGWKGFQAGYVASSPHQRAGPPEPKPDKRANVFFAEQDKRAREVEAERQARLARKANDAASSANPDIRGSGTALHVVSDPDKPRGPGDLRSALLPVLRGLQA